MSSTLRIYHNPRCSKSRQALQLLHDNGHQPEVIEYLKTPLRPQEIEQLRVKLNGSIRDIIRTSETEYKTNKLADTTLSHQQLINAIVESPKLLQRPIVVNGNQAVIGRPPEAVLALL